MLSPLVPIVQCFAVVLPFKILLAVIRILGKSYSLRPGLNRENRCYYFRRSADMHPKHPVKPKPIRLFIESYRILIFLF